VIILLQIDAQVPLGDRWKDSTQYFLRGGGIFKTSASPPGPFYFVALLLKR
jgi:hypothetical protein